jgi:hypothetical protein
VVVVFPSGAWAELGIDNFGSLKAASEAGEVLTQHEAAYAGIAPTLTKGASTSVADVIEALRVTYSGEVGAEFAYVEDAAERAWLAKEFETAFGPGAADVSAAAAKNAFTLMSMTDSFETFLARRLPTYKRYSGEGTEALVPALDAIFATACAAGVKDVVMGKAHRGRLGLLVSLLDYPARKMFWKVRLALRSLRPCVATPELPVFLLVRSWQTTNFLRMCKLWMMLRRIWGTLSIDNTRMVRTKPARLWLGCTIGSSLVQAPST